MAVAIAAGLVAAWTPMANQHVLAQDQKDPAPKKQGLGATPAKAFRAPEGFDVELVYEVPSKEQGSWVAMCVDLKGRLIVSDQYGKLYRVTPGAPGQGAQTKVEPIDVNLGMAQGLLHTKDGLYVDVNGEGILD
ncbi:MAG: heme-binding protein, partial [Planctomycetes bacterium]|nr:heme-binding protein [Planctomycetota bacterium]